MHTFFLLDGAIEQVRSLPAGVPGVRLGDSGLVQTLATACRVHCQLNHLAVAHTRELQCAPDVANHGGIYIQQLHRHLQPSSGKGEEAKCFIRI